jgi:hypothetical protein
LTIYRNLYYRWEREQWEAGALDLSADGAEWSELPVDLRSAIQDLASRGKAASARAIGEIVARIDAAPTEEQQVLWTTRLVDAARHAVFFDLLASELAGAVAEAAPDAGGPTLQEIEGLLARLEEHGALGSVRAGLAYVLRDRGRHAAFPRDET